MRIITGNKFVKQYISMNSVYPYKSINKCFRTDNISAKVSLITDGVFLL